jgi:hypothetical protein
MKILFLTRSFVFLRNFEPVLRMLAERGHSIHLASQAKEDVNARWAAEKLASDYSTITVESLPYQLGSEEVWFRLARDVQYCLDYLRFRDPEYGKTGGAIAAVREWDASKRTYRGLRLVRRLTELPGFRTRPVLSLITACLTTIQRAIPPSHAIVHVLQRHDPDVVLLTPLVEFGSIQFDHLKAAKALGIPTVFCVASWDNLSSKALLRIMPDRVTAWNETQKQEAVRLHGVPEERIVVTGAQIYDHWFDWRPSSSREQFCHAIGLVPERPFLLYVCSALFKESGSEWDLIEEWIGQLRSRGSQRLREAGILIRPHPKRLQTWRDEDHARMRDLERLGNVAVWPRTDRRWGSDDWNRDYYDSMYHSLAVVGVNTSALIESGIVGRPVYTILDPKVADSQTKTIHFHYLMDVNGGLLHVARSYDDHVSQLNELLDGGDARGEMGRQFIEAFVRPHGIDVPATPIFVSAVEDLAAMGRACPSCTEPYLTAVRLLLHPIVALMQLQRKLVVRRARRRMRRFLDRINRESRRAARKNLRRAESALHLKLVRRRARRRMRRVLQRINQKSRHAARKNLRRARSALRGGRWGVRRALRQVRIAAVNRIHQRR